MSTIMSQNGRKMAKIRHNAAKKLDWEYCREISSVIFFLSVLKIQPNQLMLINTSLFLKSVNH